MSGMLGPYPLPEAPTRDIKGGIGVPVGGLPRAGAGRSRSWRFADPQFY